MRIAFSLVELSIVLVILGLLTGGILSGQNLIRSAELRRIPVEYEQILTATHSFKEHYFQLPGDMPNATKFWGAYSNCGSTAIDTLGDVTCDGNGDGKITHEATNGREVSEIFLFWQHLGLAGLLNGTFTGVSGPLGSSDSNPGTNVMASAVPNGAWGLEDVDLSNGNTSNYSIDCGQQHFEYGAKDLVGITSGFFDYDTDGPVLAPAEAWQIDTKIDDGRPAHGKIIARYWNNYCSDASAYTDYDSEYRVHDDAIKCSLIFRDGF